MQRQTSRRYEKKKKKLETPVLAEIENILKKRNISAAAYHGGKLNGVDCRELLTIAMDLFNDAIQPYLLSVVNPDKCEDSMIINSCTLHRDISMTLDVLCSLLRMKNGEPQQEHFDKADAHLSNLQKLWQKASLSITPKMHTLLNHSVHQMKAFEGIGDTMEDDVEMMHQVAARIESRVSRMKNKDQQAFIHSKMESIVSNIEVNGKVKQVEKETKRIFKKRNAECCASFRAKKLKEEREEKRNQTAEVVHISGYGNLITTHKKAVAEKLLQQDQISFSDAQLDG